MRYARWMLCAVVVAAMAAPSLLFGQDNEAPKNVPPPKKPARAPKKKPARMRGEYAPMAKEVSLTAEQQAKVRQAVEAAKTEREAWEKENGPKVKELREQLNKLYAQRNALRAERREALMAILTPEQQVKWKGFVLYRSMMGRFRRAKLTDEQAQSVRTLCGEAVKDDEHVKSFLDKFGGHFGAEEKDFLYQLFSSVPTFDILVNEAISEGSINVRRGEADDSVLTRGWNNFLTG